MTATTKGNLAHTGSARDRLDALAAREPDFRTRCCLDEIGAMCGVSRQRICPILGLRSGARRPPRRRRHGSTPSNQNPNGTFKSNEDPTHEANESQQQEAAEDSGQFHDDWHGGKSNEDPAHEANESADREAQENAGQSNTSPRAAPSTSPSTTSQAPHPQKHQELSGGDRS